MAKFLQKAIKRPGRLRKMLDLEEGQPVTSGAIASKRKQLKKRGRLDKSTSGALALGQRLISGEFSRKRSKI